MQQLGRYEIIRELGRGAMGVVYAAIDPLIGRQVAIKTIRLDALGDESTRDELTRRLFREAQSAGILSHPGIITIHDIGERLSNAYIVMEFVTGKTLEDILASGVPQPSATFLSILKQTAEALDYAHSKGIVHRDIKPSNIMISTNGAVKIADFGVAKLSASTSLTQAGFVLGTPSYMSPEHAQGHETDGRADQFSLAVVAYRILTGKLPFDGPTLTAVLSKILWEEPEYESSGLPSFLRPAFEKAFSKTPPMRFESCVDFVRELESCYARHREEQQSKLQPAAVPIAPTAVQPAPDMPAEEEPEVIKQGGTWKWIALAAAVILAVAALFFVKHAPQQPPRAELQVPVTVPTSVAEATQPEISNTVPSSSPAIEPKSGPVSKQPAAEPPVRKFVPSAGQAPGPASGFISWTGNLPKNSILVIDGPRASIGTIEGNMLPGDPVTIDVDPKEVEIRQTPTEANAWKRLMLYSGSAKYSAISIHWQLLKK